MKRRTKEERIEYILKCGVVHDERHQLSLEVALDRLREGLSLTPTSKILLGYYGHVFVDLRNQEIGKAKGAKGDGRGKHKRTPEMRARIAAAQRERHARRRAEGKHGYNKAPQI